jgi:chemotaxis signal transduction protein
MYNAAMMCNAEGLLIFEAGGEEASVQAALLREVRRASEHCVTLTHLPLQGSYICMYAFRGRMRHCADLHAYIYLCIWY